jgi:hypothetical protein
MGNMVLPGGEVQEKVTRYIQEYKIELQITDGQLIFMLNDYVSIYAGDDPRHVFQFRQEKRDGIFIIYVNYKPYFSISRQYVLILAYKDDGQTNILYVRIDLRILSEDEGIYEICA